MHDDPIPHYFPSRMEGDRLDVTGILRSRLEREPGRAILSFGVDPWTAGRIHERVIAVQARLAQEGVGRGARVAVMLENSPDHVALIYALILMGAVWIPVNTRLKAPGIEYVLGHARPDLLICGEAFEPEVLAACQIAGYDRLLPEAALAAAVVPAGGALTCAPVGPGDLLCIIYTSGTTGAPKGVLFSHRMLRIAAESVLLVADVRAGDRLFLWEPLCHIGGAQMLLVPFLADATLHLVPRFSASRFWDQVAEGGCTQVHYLGGILDILMRLPSRPATHTLRVGWGAGVAKANWAAVRDGMGIALRECYGMTEGSSFATLNAEDRPGSVGKALPWLSVELLDDQDRPVPVGEPGQVVVSSRVPGTFFSGYLDNPGATREALRHGKLYTGDMARADADGYLYFVGRRTDSMRIRGENVSAWEIERIAATHPDVAAAAAVGVESGIGEQDVLLYVQWLEGRAQAFDGLSAWLGDRLASFQWPRYYASVDRFETTPSERIRKHRLPRALDGAWDRLAASRVGSGMA
ncbi:Long-chain-fatty-acid--CoA ligase OS=Castellaniella defragrans (strain DSM / CCUG 39792 / 65Phen)OX=1437824 GN=BN940_15436 PE=3 SV=1 [Castellaniella denitrificans]